MFLMEDLRSFVFNNVSGWENGPFPNTAAAYSSLTKHSLFFSSFGYFLNNLWICCVAQLCHKIALTWNDKKIKLQLASTVAQN